VSALTWFDRALAWVMWLAAALVVVALFAGPRLLAAEKQGATTETATPAGTAAPAPGAAGEAVFASAGCASCHTLAAAGASGAVGPNLDERRPDAAAVEAIVTAGGGTMPSFQDRLSAEEIKAVAEYVAGSAGR
jgi:mono/diheme cytochrome c family protein